MSVEASLSQHSHTTQS